LISSTQENKFKKIITSKDQYVVQRAKNAYIIIMTQSETNFDLFLIVQIINVKEENAKRLNKRLQ
jgi:hypothetical protein